MSLKRAIENQLNLILKSFPAVYISGPRQAGKTTLAEKIIKNIKNSQYYSFDNFELRASAISDPEVFLRSLQGTVVLDEIQMVPEIFRPLKIIIDENRKNPDKGVGKFILTGSASLMSLPKLSDALVGRMALKTLLPFSLLEVNKKFDNTFIDKIFNDEFSIKNYKKDNILELITSSTFYDLINTTDPVKDEWCTSYIETLLQRDVRELMDIEKILSIPDMLKLFAIRTGGLLNEASLSKELKLNHLTAKKYRILLENLFLTLSIPSWSNNLGKRLIKAPKIYLMDINLLTHLSDNSLEDIQSKDQAFFGRIVENFVAVELKKQLSFSKTKANIFHYRTSGNQEIDFIIESRNQDFVAIEVKSRGQVSKKDFTAIESIKNDMGAKFKKGIVLYNGDKSIPFGKDLWALPLESLYK